VLDGIIIVAFALGALFGLVVGYVDVVFLLAWNDKSARGEM
jgi:hypothetical protein